MSDAVISRVLKDCNVNIEQTTGTSTNSVMSQNASTNSFASKTHSHVVSDLISGTLSVSMGGTGATNVSADMAKQLGQSSFVNKSDNFVTVRCTQNSMTIEVDLGISDKSYSKGKAHGKTLASGISWTPTMALGGTNLSESAFEYYYANMIVHEANALQQANALNNYLGAKASAFIISGVEGGDKAQAYFIRYANKLVYVPDMLRKMASKNKGLTVKPVSTSIKNEFIQKSKNKLHKGKRKIYK